MSDNNNGIVSNLADAFHGFISGDAFKQGIKDALARHFGSPAPSDHDKAIADMNKQANDQRVQDANASHALSEQQAAKIRAKATK